MTPSLRFGLPAAVVVGALIPFSPSLDGDFLNWDDRTNFVDNPGYRGLGPAELRWMFTSTLLGHYIPLTWLSLAVNYTLGGLEPSGYHLGNLLLHGANAGLLYVVARQLLAAGLGGGAQTDARVPAVCWGGALAALAWAVHPLRVESVAWLTERRDVLSALFFLIAVWGYLRAVEASGRRRWRWFAASLGAFGAALLSKGMAMTLPAVLLLLDWYPLRRSGLGWRRLLAEKLMFFILAAGGAAVVWWAVRQGAAVTGYGEYGVAARIAMVAYSVTFYPWKLVWPVGLSPLYELPAGMDPFAARFLVAIVAMVVVTVALVLLRHRCPALLAAWAYSAVVVAPVSGIVHAGYQLAHDRYSYLSGMSFAVVVGAGVTWALLAMERGALRKWVIRFVVLAVAGLLLGWGMAAWRQSLIWRDSETLWRAALARDPSCGICANNLGDAIIRGSGLDAARRDEAEEHFRRALRIHPRLADAYHNLGAVLAAQQRYAEAEAMLRWFTWLAPERAEAPARLGMLYVDQERYAEAIPLLRRALSMRADLPGARADLARALRHEGERAEREGKPAEARVLFMEAAELSAALDRAARPLRGR